jgi:hypothetical protein
MFIHIAKKVSSKYIKTYAFQAGFPQLLHTSLSFFVTISAPHFLHTFPVGLSHKAVLHLGKRLQP